MTFIKNYNQFVETSFKRVHRENEVAMEKAAKILYESQKNHHNIYTFGTGHSHMLGQDLYARAGGYAQIYPIIEVELTLATHPLKSTYIERTADYANVLEELYTLEKGDVMIVASNSGRNALVIEYVLRAKAKGVKIIAITSLAHSKQVKSRHENGLRLFELADVVLDNVAPHGDAGVAINDDIIMGPISTLTGCYLSQCIIGRMVELLIEDGEKVNVFKSSNSDGADATNKELFRKYVVKSFPN